MNIRSAINKCRLMQIKNRYIILAGLLILLTQCGPQRRLAGRTGRIPETPDKRYSFALARNRHMSPFTIHNIRIQYQIPGNSTRLKAAVKLKRDSAILLSLRAPLGIEVSRILYTQDSITMVDRRNKSVHYTNYSNFSGMLPMDFDYEVLQTVFTGNVPAGYQVRALPEPPNTRDTIKNETYLGTCRAPDGSENMSFYGWIYNDILKPSYLVFYKPNRAKKLKVHFLSYEKDEQGWLPEEVEIRSNNKQYNNTLKLKMSQFDRGGSVNMDLDIPSSYKILRY